MRTLSTNHAERTEVSLAAPAWGTPTRGWLLWSCRLLALALGAGSAWAARSTMYPDGVSYLDVGDAFWHGDWHNAINAYWSPLYPIILGGFMRFFHPRPPREYPLVHLVNVLIYAGALVCFDFFLRAFLEQQRRRQDELATHSEVGLPDRAWLLAGYSAFLISSLSLVTISFVSGDMIVVAMIFLASTLILKIHKGDRAWQMFAALGLTLGIGYLAKAVMFLMSLPFIGVAAATQPGRRTQIRCAAISLAFFFISAGPFVLLLSVARGHPSFGESGKINYLMNVGTTQFFTPHEPAATHPVRQLAALPHAYEYATPISGTYPLWFDPAYWHEGIPAHIDAKRQIRTMLLAFAECIWISISPSMGLAITVAIVWLYMLAPRVRCCVITAAANWPLWVPAVAGIALYSLVVIEPRYVAALFCLLWMVAFSGVRLPESTSQHLIEAVVWLLAVAVCLTAGWHIYEARESAVFAKDDVATPECSRVAEALIERGVHPGDRIAIISEWLFPSRQGAYIARLVRARIVAEARSAEYWQADDTTRSELMKEFADCGVRAVLTYKPLGSEAGWWRLAGTGYYLHLIPDSERTRR